ncbi:MAG: 50S ribosomal protein L33 [Candidatus Berkelbacteria bacterium]|nr:50S ribosomal protein L33 [Candidatus Berkelbacteria bacterium]
MAKESRPVINLKCIECKRINYQSEKNIHKTKEALELKKYCKWCKKRTGHRETK